MKDIDFLPRQYHEQNASRKAHIWRAGVFLIFSGAIATAALVQYALARSTEFHLEEVKQEYAEALARQSQFAQSQQDLEAEEQAARLYAFLGHPWPRTRVLAEIAEPLPHSVAIVEIHLKRETNRAAANRTQWFSGERGEEGAAETAPSPARDLERLLTEIGATQSVVKVTGLTADATALHGFVDALGKSRLIDAAELSTFESAPGMSDSNLMQFELRLVLRPGYGAPGGPHEELLANAAAGGERTNP